MTDDAHRKRWAELEVLLDDLLELPQAEREARLRELESADGELHSAVSRLLAAVDTEDSFLERGAEHFSGEALEHLVEELHAHSEISSSTPESSTTSPPTLGRYRLLERLGSGGMGDVWVAERDDDILQQTVAIKILRPLVGEDAQRRFDRERHILASLQHDGIARILDAGVSPGTPPYLVLEYVEGGEITQYCRAESLPRNDRLKLFVQVCDAVSHAHRRLIVHRDLKPSNILVNKAGQVKLLDFGIAKLLDPAEFGIGDAVTRVGLLPMTPEYAAPEQIRGEAVTTATDVYGLGTLLYELLSGERPFDTQGLSPAELERLVCDTEAPRPSNAPSASPYLRKALRGELDTIVLKALEKKPEDRYPSVADLAGDVNNYLRGLPLTARPATITYRARKFVHRHRLTLAGATVLLIALAIGLFGTAWQAREAELQKARFESTGEFLFTLFEQVDPDLNPGSQLTAVSLLDVGTSQLEKFAAGPEARVDLLRVLGVLYSKLGERERGEALLRRAVDEAKSSLAPDNGTIGQALSSLGGDLAKGGQLAESEAMLRESLDAFAVAGATGRWPLGTEHSLALTLYLQGHWQEAEASLAENIRNHEPFLADDPRNLTHRSLVTALALRGELQSDLDQWEASAESLERAVALGRERMGPDHPILARSLETLGALRHKEGDLAAAESSLQQALAVRRGAHPGGHQSIARIFAHLATLQSTRGQPAESQQLFADSVRLWGALPRGTHSEQADQFRALASLQLGQGELESALSNQLSALGARRLAHGSNDHWRVADEVHQLALIELAASNLGEAESLMERARTMRSALLGETHSSVGESLAALAELRQRQAQLSEASELLAGALTIWSAALPPDHPAVRRAERALRSLPGVR